MTTPSPTPPTLTPFDDDELDRLFDRLATGDTDSEPTPDTDPTPDPSNERTD